MKSTMRAAVLLTIVFILACLWQVNERVPICSFPNPGGVGGQLVCEKVGVSASPLTITYQARRSGTDPNQIAYVFVRYGDNYVQKKVTSTAWESGSITIDVPTGVDIVLVGLRWLNKPPNTGETVYLRNVHNRR